MSEANSFIVTVLYIQLEKKDSWRTKRCYVHWS